MNIAELREFVDRDPFEPFRVRLSSGDVYEIRNPDLVVVMKSRMFVADAHRDRYTFIPYLHIAAIETIGNGSSRRHRRHKSD